MDGLDLDSPEPSANRSRSYRHGFDRGREDRGVMKSALNVDALRRMANEAMDADECDRIL